MYGKETKNINKLLKYVNIPGVMNWRVSDLRDMEWEGEIRLTLHVVIDSDFFGKKYNWGYNQYQDYSHYQWETKQSIIRIFKHYVHSFLGLKIGDVNTVNLISYQITNPTSYYTTYNYTNTGGYNNLYTIDDDYDRF